MKAPRRLVVLLLLILLPGCRLYHETVGRPLPENLSGLKTGETTKAEALAVLGAPDSVQRQFDGDLYLWYQADNWSERLLLVPLLPIYDRTRGETRTDRLSLLFDRDGILRGLGLQREIPREP